MTEKKEPLEIKCSSCSAHFRLWIPVGKMGEWERGSTINCIRCGSPYLIKKAAAGFEVTQVRGNIENGAVSHYQVTLKVGFTLDE